MSAAMAGLILLLLFGTDFLDWRWITVLAAASLGAGFWKLRREIPSSYGTARKIDTRLGLQDTLSTAYYYGSAECRRTPSAAIRSAQLAEAERMASEVDVVLAVPIAMPKSLYVMAGLFLVASSLFALRYGISRTLDLRPPLATLVFDAFHFASDPQVAEKKKREIRHSDDRLKQFGLPLDTENRNGTEGSTPGLSTEAPDAEGTKKEASADSSRQRGSASTETLNRRNAPGDQGEGEGSESGQSAENERKAEGQERSSKGEPSGKNSAKQESASSQHESNGLLDKFRDAMENLLSRLKSQPKQGDSQQASNSSRPDSNMSRREQGQKGSEKGGHKTDGSPNGDSEGDEQGEGAQKAQSGPGKQGGRDAQQASAQGQSGIGKDDGSKDIREAEQMAAMGKISELIGKRSQNLTGEAMVEVASGRQELRTQYSQQSVKHTDAGGEIHRDEIPLVYQRYVQQYFEQIRKGAGQSAPSAAQPK